ncbi:Major intrinsic protein, partial [Trinorchestia longiramus]
FFQALGHVSGGHVNPAVTLSFCLARQMSVLRGLLYMVVQIAGGIAAAGILYGVVPTIYQSSIGIAVKNVNISDVQAFGVEVMTTFSLIMAIQGT